MWDKVNNLADAETMSKLTDLLELNKVLTTPIWDAVRSWSAQDKNSLRLPFAYLGQRALKTHESIVVLAERELGLEAGMLLRSLIEISINVRWIYEDYEVRARRWLDYDWVATRKWQRIALNLPWPKPQWMENDPAQVEAWQKLANTEAERVKNKYGLGNRDYWSGKPLERMAREVGMEQQYTVYRIYSEILHSGVKGLADSKVHPDVPIFAFNLGKNTEHSTACLQVAAQTLGMTFLLVGDILGLDLEEHLQKIIERLKKLANS